MRGIKMKKLNKNYVASAVTFFGFMWVLLPIMIWFATLWEDTPFIVPAAITSILFLLVGIIGPVYILSEKPFDE